MKKVLLSATALSCALTAAAFAADLPSRKAPAYVPPPPPPMWTGFYVGLNAGGTFSGSDSVNLSNGLIYANPAVTPLGWAYVAPTSAALSGSLPINNGGFIGGGQVGYNWQFGAGSLGGGFGGLGGGAFVVGIEADIQGIAGGGTNANASTAVGVPAPGGPNPVTAFLSASKSLDYLGTVRGRLGYLVMPTLLAYATGGLAYGGVNGNSSYLFNDNFGPTNVNNAFSSAGSFSDTRVGWTVGGGLEWMFMPNWSAKVEYLYYDLNSVTFVNAPAGKTYNASAAAGLAGQIHSLYATSISSRFNGHIVRAGVNYHFNWGAPAPVLAKY